MIDCETMDCQAPAVRYVTCEGDGAYPYCASCSDVLLNGHEEDRGPVDQVTDETVEDAAQELYAAGPWGDFHGFSDGGLGARAIHDTHDIEVYRAMVRCVLAVTHPSKEMDR